MIFGNGSRAVTIMEDYAMKPNSQSTRHRKSAFLRGIASILNILPPTRPARFSIPNLAKTDSEALAQDWKTVGADVAQAIQIEMNRTRPHGA